MKKNILYDKEVYEIQGAIFAVYREMGNAWHEEVYQQCLERELLSRMIPFDHKKELRIYYKGGATRLLCRANGVTRNIMLHNRPELNP